MKGGKSKADTKKADSKLKVKGDGKRAKAIKDPNKPKRPPSAFFVFMEDFRKQYKEQHPENKAVSVVGKAGGAQWKTMSVAEKAPYAAKAEKRKSEYNKDMQNYNNKSAKAAITEDDESDKSKSEVNDEDEEVGSVDDDDDE